MKILYFFHREYAPQSGIILAAYLKRSSNGQIFYERVEYLTLFTLKGSNQVVSFYHEFAKNDHDILWIRNRKELLSDIAKDQLEIIEGHNYIRFREAALNIYKGVEIPDFKTFNHKNN